MRSTSLGLVLVLASAGCSQLLDFGAAPGTADDAAAPRGDATALPRADAGTVPDPGPDAPPDARPPCVGSDGGSTGAESVVDTGTRCYMAFKDTLTWDGATAACAALDATLLTTTDATELVLIEGLLDPTGVASWIGLSDIVVAETFVWSTGEPLVFTAWNTGEPNNTGTLGELDADCASILRTAAGPRWADRPCTYLQSYVCER